MPWPLTLLVANNVSRSVVLRRTNGVVVGRIFTVPTAPQGRPWMWASGHGGFVKRAAHGYEASPRNPCEVRSARQDRAARAGSTPCQPSTVQSIHNDVQAGQPSCRSSPPHKDALARSDGRNTSTRRLRQTGVPISDEIRLRCCLRWYAL